MTIGERVIIADNISGHPFKIGEVVEIIEVDLENNRLLIEDKDFKMFYVTKKEINPK